MKKWTITVTCNYVTLENKYTAYAEEDPVNNIINDYIEELADDLYNDYSSRITEDYDEFVEDVQIYSKPAEIEEDYTIIYDERDNLIKPWIVEIYSDPRCSDAYAAYASCSSESELEEQIGTNEELMLYLIDAHIGEWDTYIEEDEYEEWQCSIGPHAHLVEDKDMNDEAYMKWFNSLEVIYDERNEIE